jgi:hypothetical protein
MRVAMFIVLAMVLLASSQAPAAKKQHAVRPEELLTLIQMRTRLWSTACIAKIAESSIRRHPPQISMLLGPKYNPAA